MHRSANCQGTSRAGLVAGLSLVVLLAASPGRTSIIQHIHYAPTSLPSDQGWVYRISDHHPEADAFSVDDGLLRLDTIGDGVSAFSYYERDLLDDPSVTHVSASFRVRVLDVEPESDAGVLSLAFTYKVPGGAGRAVMISLSATSVDVHNGHPPYAIDATQWHEYVVTVTLDDGFCRLYVDGVSNRTWFEPSVPQGRAVAFGDNYSPNNVHAEIAAVDVWLSDDGEVAVQGRSWSGVKSLFGD